MGFIHDTHTSYYIPPTLFHRVTGTWTHAAGQVTDTVVLKVNDANQTSTVNIPVIVPSNSSTEKGCRLKSIEIDYEVVAAALEEVTAVVNKVTRGADGAVAVVAAQTFAYDVGNDTAAERYAVGQHRMVLTLGTLAVPVPAWIDNDVYYLVELTINQAGDTGVIEFLGAVANVDLRI